MAVDLYSDEGRAIALSTASVDELARELARRPDRVVLILEWDERPLDDGSVPAELHITDDVPLKSLRSMLRKAHQGLWLTEMLEQGGD